MKPILPPPLRMATVIGIALLMFGPRAAQAETTNATPASTGNETHISSKYGRFDFNTRSLVYSENVQLEDPRIRLTCEYLLAKFPTNGNHRVDSVIAETNVVALITTNDITYKITAAKAVFIYRPEATTTNETLELTGLPEPVIQWVPADQTPLRTNTFTARRIVWDLLNNNITAEDNRGVFPDFRSPTRRAQTEAPAATNATPEPKPATP